MIMIMCRIHPHKSFNSIRFHSLKRSEKKRNKYKNSFHIWESFEKWQKWSSVDTKGHLEANKRTRTTDGLHYVVHTTWKRVSEQRTLLPFGHILCCCVLRHSCVVGSRLFRSNILLFIWIQYFCFGDDKISQLLNVDQHATIDNMSVTTRHFDFILKFVCFLAAPFIESLNGSLELKTFSIRNTLQIRYVLPSPMRRSILFFVFFTLESLHTIYDRCLSPCWHKAKTKSSNNDDASMLLLSVSVVVVLLCWP